MTNEEASFYLANMDRKYMEKGMSEALDIAIEALEQTRWIPVSERLPSDNEYVIVSALDDNGDTPWKYTTEAWICKGVWISDNDILCGTVVAWMPLSQPYEPQESEKINCKSTKCENCINHNYCDYEPQESEE